MIGSQGTTTFDATFAGPGAVRALCRSMDWGATAVGPVGRWPPSLRTAVRMCLDAPTPMAVWAVPGLTLIYNDLYAGLLGLLVFVLIAGDSAMGAQRWIALGPFKFQPSEFARMTLALILAMFFGENRRGARNTSDLIIGGIFLVEALSVILQVLSYKLLGRRIFLMAPLHHHFEMKAWSETRIMVRFWIATAILCACGFVLYYAYFSNFNNLAS